MTDETSDCGPHEQLSILIRCYDSNTENFFIYFF